MKLSHLSFASALLAAAGCVAPVAERQQPGLRSVGTFPPSAVQARSTNCFESVTLWKPAESTDLPSTFAPLLLIQSPRGPRPIDPDANGLALISNGSPVTPLAPPAVFSQVDSVLIHAKSHTRFSYIWYSAPVTTNAASLYLRQGVRITLDSKGFPAIWEVLTDSSGFRVLYTAASLEEAARRECGDKLPDRRYALERGLQETPSVVLARVLEDGPVPMGPLVYVTSSGDVSTVLCRCMPAQASSITGTHLYNLRQGAPQHGFPDGAPLETVLRIPETF